MLWFTDTGDIPPCGIGGASVSGGPCSGTYSPSQAGQDAFSLLSSHSSVMAVIAAGALIAALLFAVWAVRKVARFFGGKGKPKHKGGEPGTYEHTQAFWQARGREANATQADADFSAYGRGDDDTEDDIEDDSPLELEDDSEGVTHRLGYGR